MIDRTNIHLAGTLRLVEIDEHWSIYEAPDGTDVYLQHGTARVLVAFEEIDLSLALTNWRNEPVNECRSTCCRSKFLDWLRARTYEPDDVDGLDWCADCGDLEMEDNLYSTNGNHGQVCDGCLDSYWYCSHCEERYPSTTTINGDVDACSSCVDNHYSWCEDCDGYYYTEDGCGTNHNGDGCCESPAMSFSIRNDGAGPLANDEKVSVSLPAGTISPEGTDQIMLTLARLRQTEYDTTMAPYSGLPGAERQAVREVALERYAAWSAVIAGLESLGDKWQAKDGNYTKRLSRMAYKTAGVKIPPDLLSEIGNIASAHSGGADYTIAVTRDLNLPREEFAHAGSCWWTEYYESRCALKTNGGFGLRSFDGCDVVGRAWVLPLRLDNGALTPTFDTENADAFMVFNGYGNLSGYTPVRMLAHMLGVTYRKVEFKAEPMYVNNNSGYLLAAEEIAERYTDGIVRLVLEQHADLYETEQFNAVVDGTMIEETVNA